MAGGSRKESLVPKHDDRPAAAGKKAHAGSPLAAALVQEARLLAKG